MFISSEWIKLYVDEVYNWIPKTPHQIITIQTRIYQRIKE